MKASGYKPRINHKGSRAKSLSGRQKQVNRAYSEVRARVEHVFGTMSNEMEQNHHQASGTELFSETTLPSSGETLQVFLKETHTDAIMIAHKSSVVANWYAPHFDPINTHILFPSANPLPPLSQEFCNIKDCLIPHRLYRIIFPFRLNRPIPTVLSSICWI